MRRDVRFGLGSKGVCFQVKDIDFSSTKKRKLEVMAAAAVVCVLESDISNLFLRKRILSFM